MVSGKPPGYITENGFFFFSCDSVFIGVRYVVLFLFFRMFNIFMDFWPFSVLS
jgi:hypothetical protein